MVVQRGWTALRTPLAASLPPWHADLTTYIQTISHAEGQHTGQLVTAVLLLAIASGLTAAALLATWAQHDLLDSNAFADTSTALIKDGTIGRIALGPQY